MTERDPLSNGPQVTETYSMLGRFDTDPVYAALLGAWLQFDYELSRHDFDTPAHEARVKKHLIANIIAPIVVQWRILSDDPYEIDETVKVAARDRLYFDEFTDGFFETVTPEGFNE